MRQTGSGSTMWSAGEKVTVVGDLEILDLPEEVLRALRRRAVDNHRGVEDEAAAILIEAVSPHIRLGSTLTEIGAQIELTDAELAAFDRDRSPRESLISDISTEERPRPGCWWPTIRGSPDIHLGVAAVGYRKPAPEPCFAPDGRHACEGSAPQREQRRPPQP